MSGIGRGEDGNFLQVMIHLALFPFENSVTLFGNVTRRLTKVYYVLICRLMSPDKKEADTAKRPNP
jgi:hypothetical protein